MMLAAAACCTACAEVWTICGCGEEEGRGELTVVAMVAIPPVPVGGGEEATMLTAVEWTATGEGEAAPLTPPATVVVLVVVTG